MAWRCLKGPVIMAQMVAYTQSQGYESFDEQDVLNLMNDDHGMLCKGGPLGQALQKMYDNFPRKVEITVNTVTPPEPSDPEVHGDFRAYKVNGYWWIMLRRGTQLIGVHKLGKVGDCIDFTGKSQAGGYRA